MKRFIQPFLIFTLLLLTASCSYTPEERAEKAVKKYCEALQDNDFSEISKLTFESPETECVAEEANDTEESLASNLHINIAPQCVVTPGSDFTIVSVTNIYSNMPKPESEEDSDEEVAPEECVPEAAEVTDEYPDDYYIAPAVLWPDYVWAAYEVVVESASHHILFTVVQLDEKDFKIYSTKGLYTYDFSEVTNATGCSAPSLPEDVTDEVMEQNVNTFIDRLKTFDIFANAVANGDTAKIIRIFPRIANYTFDFNGKPVPDTYTQKSYGAEITANDSLAFKISSDGKIIDSKGVISSKTAEDAVKAEGGTPKSRGDYYDIEYIEKLYEQARALKNEKERKEKAAKYKAQGLALVSSSFSSNGSGAKGIEFSVLNTSGKTAKYVIVEVVGYNMVNDPVWDGGYIMRCRGIGPVSPGDVGSWNFNNLWEKGSIVSTYEIKTITMQYTDGTSKSLRLPRALPSDWRSWLY